MEIILKKAFTVVHILKIKLSHRLVATYSYMCIHFEGTTISSYEVTDIYIYIPFILFQSAMIWQISHPWESSMLTALLHLMRDICFAVV